MDREFQRQEAERYRGLQTEAESQSNFEKQAVRQSNFEKQAQGQRGLERLPDALPPDTLLGRVFRQCTKRRLFPPQQIPNLHELEITPAKDDCLWHLVLKQLWKNLVGEMLHRPP